MYAGAAWDLAAGGVHLGTRRSAAAHQTAEGLGNAPV